MMPQSANGYQDLLLILLLNLLLIPSYSLGTLPRDSTFLKVLS